MERARPHSWSIAEFAATARPTLKRKNKSLIIEM